MLWKKYSNSSSSKKIKNLRALWSIHQFHSWSLILLVSNTAVQNWEYLSIPLCSTCTGFSSTSPPFIFVMSHWKLPGQESCTAKAHMHSRVLQNNAQRVSVTVFVDYASSLIQLSWFFLLLFILFLLNLSYLWELKLQISVLLTTEATYLPNEIHSLIHKFHNSSTSPLDPYSLPLICLFSYIFLVSCNQSCLFHCEINEISNNLENQSDFLNSVLISV